MNTEMLYGGDPAAGRRPGRSLTVILILAAIAIVAALGGAMYAVNAHAASQQQLLEQKITSLQHKLSQDESTLSSQGSQISGLSAQLAGLTQPSDPLSNYNAVCSQDMTNSQTGVYGLWYFPCTNQVTTTPQPSGG